MRLQDYRHGFEHMLIQKFVNFSKARISSTRKLTLMLLAMTGRIWSGEINNKFHNVQLQGLFCTLIYPCIGYFQSIEQFRSVRSPVKIKLCEFTPATKTLTISSDPEARILSKGTDFIQHEFHPLFSDRADFVTPCNVASEINKNVTSSDLRTGSQKKKLDVSK